MKETLKVAIVQTIVDSTVTWNNSPKMDLYEANAIWRQVQSAFTSFGEMSVTNRPAIRNIKQRLVFHKFIIYGNKI